MRIDNRIILIGIVTLTLILFPVAAFTTGLLRIILSFLCLIFFPGYTLISALFPKQGDIGATERIALSFGASIAIVPIIGFVLNFSPWGVRLVPVLVSMGLFILIMAVTGFLRQQLLPRELRFGIPLKSGWAAWRQMTAVKKVLSISGFLVVIAIASLVVYLAVSLPYKPSPTEFYILNTKGAAGNYPRQVKVNDNISLTAVIINHENQNTGYSIQITDKQMVQILAPSGAVTFPS
ncbi:MAG: DUF1616 domain-containing protein [Chloroflexi bacterium]|nr:DUF1616 domain-containing protein [Chloroflexota bacterium]